MITRLERRAKIVDETAVAVELLRAAEYRKESQIKHQEDLNNQFEKWLRPSNIREIHNQQVTARLDGTCDWITLDPAFKKWFDSAYPTIPDRFLCISGKHCCGKSVLSSFIFSRLEDEERNRTLLFSFSSSDTNRFNAENLIRTILWQLVQKNADVKSEGIIRGLMSKGQPITPELWESLGNVLGSISGPTYCIIDGIDECSDFEEGVSKRLLKLLDAHPKLRIMLLGRPHAIQALHQSTISQVHVIEIIPTMLKQDLEAYIKDEISRSDILRLPEFRDKVFTTLSEKADGMFLWAKLMIHDLRKSSTRSEMVERLQNLPRGLEEAYTLVFSRLLQRLDSFELRLAQRVFTFIIVAIRPLTFEEFRYIYALDRRSTANVEHPMEDYLLLKPIETVLDICGGLVFLRNGCMGLIHSSVKDFLLRSQDWWIKDGGSSIVAFQVKLDDAHQALASRCLDYLCIENGELTSERLGSVQTFKQCYPFLEYASLYAIHHVNRSGPPSMAMLGKIQNVLGSAQGIVWIERFASQQSSLSPYNLAPLLIVLQYC